MGYLKKQGKALLDNGYLIIPVKPGKKSPAIHGWETARMAVGDLGKYGKAGVGVLCGQGEFPIAAIDIDTTNAELAGRFSEWCQVHLGMTCERVGNAPKVLLAYRAESSGMRKATGAWLEDAQGGRHRVECLGHGQQFVAYHVHPDTGQPYVWTDLLGGIEHVAASDLPIITGSQIDRALAVFEGMALAEGLVKASGGSSLYKSGLYENDPLMNHEPPIGLSLNETARLLSSLDPSDYETWLQAGMSLHHEHGGDSAALDAWDTWSGTAPNYEGWDDLLKRWEAFGKSDRRPTTARWLLKFGKQAELLGQRAEKRESLAELKGKVAKAADTIELLDDVAKSARALITEVPAFSAEIADAIKQRYKALAGHTLPASELGRCLKVVQARPGESHPLSEFGNCERLLDRYGAGMMYVPEFSSWFSWTGVYWHKCFDSEIEHCAKEAVRGLVEEPGYLQNSAEFHHFYKVSQNAKMVKNMIVLAQSDPRVCVPARELDKHTRYLGVTNGVVDLRTGELLAPDPTLRITRVCGCDYMPGQVSPLFDRTLMEVFNDDREIVEFFQRVIGYTAMGEPDQDIMVIPHGNGSNGKSTVLGVIRQVFGGYAKSADATTFLSDSKGGGNAGGAREDLLRLKGARYVYVNEPDEGGELREGSVKSMTGGDAMTARGLYSKDSVEIVPTWVVFMPTNHKPIVKGQDDGIWRRLMLVPFTRNFDNDPTIVKDTARVDKLMMDKEGVLSWIVQGALAYQKMGMREVGAVKAAREEYRKEQDVLAEWLEECCEIGEALTEESSRLWKSWEQFAKDRGLLYYIKSCSKFYQKLNGRFLKVDGRVGGKRMRRGLRLHDHFEPLV